MTVHHRANSASTEKEANFLNGQLAEYNGRSQQTMKGQPPGGEIVGISKIDKIIL